MRGRRNLELRLRCPPPRLSWGRHRPARGAGRDKLRAVATQELLTADVVAKARRRLGRRDRVLGGLIRSVGPCELGPRGNPYGYLVRSVVYQQLAGRAAQAIEGRLRSHFGGRIPAARRLREAAPEDLRAVGLSRQKAATLLAIAEAFAAGVLNSRKLPRMTDEAVIEAVTQIRGVGEWTAHMLLLFSLGRPDVLPVGDYGVRKGAKSLYGLAELPGRRELERLAEPWRPYSSVAAWYLWRQAEVVVAG